MSDPQDSKPTDRPKPSPAAEKTASAGADFVDDAGSRALSEALRRSFTIVKFIMVVLVVVFLGSNLRIVEPQEKAVILRFGKPVGQGEDALLGPGAHWAFPYPIDEIVRIPVGQVQSVESSVGWYATTAAMEATGQLPPPGPSLNPERDGYMLTGDENIIHVRGTLRYRIDEPGLRYEFGLASASNLVQNAFNNALVQVAARFQVDNILTRDVAGFREAVRRRLEQLIVSQDLGIVVDQIALRTMPPRQLQEKFDAVLETEINTSQTINEAKTYANQTLSSARTRASGLLSAGESDRKRMVEFVRAEANRFQDLLPSYRRNPQLFVQQQRAEAFRRILTNVQEKILLPNRTGGKPYELRIQMNRQPQRVNLPSQPAAEGDSH